MLRIYFATYQLYFKVIIIRRRHVPLIDATGYQSIKEIVKTFKVRGIKVIISGVKKSLRKDFEKNDMFSILDKEFVVKDIKEEMKLNKKPVTMYKNNSVLARKSKNVLLTKSNA